MALGDKIVGRLLAWRPLYRLVPASSSLKHLWVFMKLLLTELDYNVWKQFDKLGCDRIYEVRTQLVCLQSICQKMVRKYICFPEICGLDLRKKIPRKGTIL